MTSSSLKSRAIASILLVLVCFGVGFFLTKPKWNAYKASQSQLRMIEAQNDEFRQSLSTVQSFTDQYSKELNNVATADLALPAKKMDSANFVKALGDMAAASGVVLADLQIDAPASADRTPAPNSIQVQHLTFTATGTYLGFKDFVMRLENSLRLVDFEKISLQSSEDDQVKYTVDLKTYYQQ